MVDDDNDDAENDVSASVGRDVCWCDGTVCAKRWRLIVRV
jgi:hypothetical protein